MNILLQLTTPAATIIAAIAAVLVTWRLGRAQLRVAEQQAGIAKRQAETAKQTSDTALDQLAYNLFEKRYAIYTATKDLLRYVVNNAPHGNFDTAEIVGFYLIIDEAPFFFPQEFCSFLKGIQEPCQKLIETAAGRSDSYSGHPRSNKEIQSVWDQDQALAKLLQEMPAHFGRVMKFQQLTQSPGVV